MQVGKKKLWVFALAGVGLWSHSASAEEASVEELSGFETGFRLGYGIPFGKATDDPYAWDYGGEIRPAMSQMNDEIAGQVPLWFDVGARIRSNFMVAAAFRYGFGVAGNNLACGGGWRCSTHDIGLGVEFLYHFRPLEVVDPWIGAGLGYEWWSVTIGGAGVITSGARGFEFLNVQGGVGFALGVPSARFGPFLSLSVGQFDSISVECTGACSVSGGGDVQNKTMHQWLIFGVRLTKVWDLSPRGGLSGPDHRLPGIRPRTPRITRVPGPPR
ncbi:MAG TPA: hypothetical protein VGJ84_03145 [Polyangiaceae bacterium]|jgi:hypothetical protein